MKRYELVLSKEENRRQHLNKIIKNKMIDMFDVTKNDNVLYIGFKDESSISIANFDNVKTSDVYYSNDDVATKGDELFEIKEKVQDDKIIQTFITKFGIAKITWRRLTKEADIYTVYVSKK